MTKDVEENELDTDVKEIDASPDEMDNSPKEMDSEPESPDAEVSPYQTLVQAVFDEKPQAFVDTFGQLMQQKVSELVAQRKLALQTSLFGAPEGLEDTGQQDAQTPDVSDESPEENSEEDKTETA